MHGAVAIRSAEGGPACGGRLKGGSSGWRGGRGRIRSAEMLGEEALLGGGRPAPGKVGAEGGIDAIGAEAEQKNPRNDGGDAETHRVGREQLPVDQVTPADDERAH